MLLQFLEGLGSLISSPNLLSENPMKFSTSQIFKPILARVWSLHLPLPPVH